MNPNNLEMIHRYQKYLDDARGLDARTIDAYLRHVLLLACAVGNRDFSSLKPDDIIRFKKLMRNKDAEETNTAEAAPRTIVQTFNSLKAFLTWLRKQPGHKSLPADLPDYCNPSRRLAALARVPNAKHVPAPEELRTILGAMPAKTFKDRRDRAVIAFLFLTGMRDGAVIGLQLKHVDAKERIVFQDPRDIQTKFSKTLTTAWFPVGEDIENIVRSWLCERRTPGIDIAAPLFPSLRKTIERQGLVTKEDFWKTADPIRKLVRRASEAASVPLFKPHAIRATLAQLALDLTYSMEELKAWSQNLGHEELGTTLQHYGKIPAQRQHELVGNMRDRSPHAQTQQLIGKLNRMSPDHFKLFENLIDGFDPLKTTGA